MDLRLSLLLQQARYAFSSDGFRVQQRELAEDNSLRPVSEADDTQERGECEVAALAVWRLRERIEDAVVLPDGFEVAFGAWSVANSETFDEGGACGDVSDRTTSVAAFDSALDRLDGAGFGNLLFHQVDYLATGTRGEVDTAIQSSMVSNLLVSSLGGNMGEGVPEAMSYGGPYFSAHVNFATLESSTPLSFPLLFHTPSQCQGGSVALDFYGAAALQFAYEIGGSIDYFPFEIDTGGSADLKFGSSAIVLDPTAFGYYIGNQSICDVFESPSYGPAAWAECSAGTQYVNTSVTVGECEVLVSPARYLVVGNYFNRSDAGVAERLSLWSQEFRIRQTELLEISLKAISARSMASSGVTQATTQVGFELDKANDTTEWFLVLIVALEVVFGVVALAFSSLYERRTARAGDPLRAEEACGKVFLVAVVLALGLVPVFIARSSEADAARMAHNDVYSYWSDTSVCSPAQWEGGNAFEWCSTTRMFSESLLVRSYSETFLRRYNVLAWTATAIGAVGFVLYAVLVFNSEIWSRPSP